jgi:hypothetical protein
MYQTPEVSFHHRTPELSLRSQIPWTERQKYRCVHGFLEPNAGSCHCVHGFRGLYCTRIMRLVRVTDSDAMKSRRGTCNTIQGFIQRAWGTGRGVPIKLFWLWKFRPSNNSNFKCKFKAFRIKHFMVLKIHQGVISTPKKYFLVPPTNSFLAETWWMELVLRWLHAKFLSTVELQKI